MDFVTSGTQNTLSTVVLTTSLVTSTVVEYLPVSTSTTRETNTSTTSQIWNVNPTNFNPNLQLSADLDNSVGFCIVSWSAQFYCPPNHYRGTDIDPRQCFQRVSLVRPCSDLNRSPVANSCR